MQAFLSNLTPFYFSVIILTVAFFALVGLLLASLAFLKASRTNKNLTTLFSGKKGADLEETILNHAQSIKEMDKEIQDLFEISNQVHKLAFRGLHKLGVIRFNPFKDVGGNQSFAVALLDGQNSGMIITSLHTREGNHVYIKPINKGASEQYPLTAEEKKAIVEANIIKPSKI